MALNCLKTDTTVTNEFTSQTRNYESNEHALLLTLCFLKKCFVPIWFFFADFMTSNRRFFEKKHLNLTWWHIQRYLFRLQLHKPLNNFWFVWPIFDVLSCFFFRNLSYTCCPSDPAHNWSTKINRVLVPVVFLVFFQGSNFFADWITFRMKYFLLHLFCTFCQIFLAHCFPELR